jgi:hypothetical protein
MSNKLPLKSNLDIQEPTALSTERILSSKMQLNVLQEEDKNLQSERFHDEIKKKTLKFSIWCSVLTCIRQALSKFCFVNENLQISFKYNFSTKFKTNILERRTQKTLI